MGEIVDLSQKECLVEGVILQDLPRGVPGSKYRARAHREAILVGHLSDAVPEQELVQHDGCQFVVGNWCGVEHPDQLQDAKI